jgi:hypothetical protein
MKKLESRKPFKYSLANTPEGNLEITCLSSFINQLLSVSKLYSSLTKEKNDNYTVTKKDKKIIIEQNYR